MALIDRLARFVGRFVGRVSETLPGKRARVIIVSPACSACSSAGRNKTQTGEVRHLSGLAGPEASARSLAIQMSPARAETLCLTKVALEH